MIVVCKDFEFDGKTLSEQNYSSLNFDDDTTLPSSIVREMDSGSMNQYRTEVNGFGIKYSDTLVFDLHIAKSFDEYTSQEEMEFSSDEYDNLLAWLSSPQENKWMTITTENNKVTKVKGYFSSIQPYDNWGICYGARCTFTCNSPFSYTEETYETNISGVQNFLLNNESSDYYDYVYPTFVIEPTKNEEIFIHNLSDTEMLDNGTFNISGDVPEKIGALQDKISAYAMTNSLSVEYMMDTETKDIKLICNGTGLLFYMTDNYGIKHKYVAYYLETDRQYYICRGGFFYCTLLSALTVSLDCKNLGVYDSLDRPVLYTDIGIQDEDEIYWMRLIHGNNSIRAMGHFNLSVTYLEPRKGLLI